MVPATPDSRLTEAAAAIQRRTDLVPRIAIVLGSGLGGLAEDADIDLVIPYAEIPGFPASTAPGHAGRLLIGSLEGQPVALLSGRAHLYEGYTPQDAVFAARLMCRLGAEALIVTNAAGGVNTSFHPGDLMLITDHINLTGRNPLVGPNDPALGVRFPDLSEAYDARLRALARRASAETGVPLVEGIYMGLLGPSYETPAEVRMVRLLGADAVGMSTVLEVIAARHCGLRVLGISCITNLAAGLSPHPLTEEGVIETANRVRKQFARLVRRVIHDWEDADGNA